MKAVIATVCFVVSGANAFAEESWAILRSGSKVAISGVSAAGIEIAPEKGRPARVDSLSQVREVAGTLAPEFEKQRGLATDLWRASSRLARGDEGGAEPLFAKLWVQTASSGGPTRAEVAAGLAACVLERGAYASAIEPWVEWVRHAAALSPEQAASGRAVLGTGEPGSIWIESLPPVWSDSVATRTLAEQATPALNASGTHPSADDLLTIYVVAARRDTGRPWQIDQTAALKDPSWANIAGEMVLSEADTPEVRAEARQRLASRQSSDVPLWKQAWIRLALGRSLLRETAADDRRSGVLNLLWIASRQGLPSRLVTIALADAGRGLLTLSDEEGARAVLDDLERRFPGDPILDSPAVAASRRDIARASARSVPSTSQPPAIPPKE